MSSRYVCLLRIQYTFSDYVISTTVGYVDFTQPPFWNQNNAWSCCRDLHYCML